MASAGVTLLSINKSTSARNDMKTSAPIPFWSHMSNNVLMPTHPNTYQLHFSSMNGFLALSRAIYWSMPASPPCSEVFQLFVFGRPDYILSHACYHSRWDLRPLCETHTQSHTHTESHKSNFCFFSHSVPAFLTLPPTPPPQTSLFYLDAGSLHFSFLCPCCLFHSSVSLSLAL